LPRKRVGTCADVSRAARQQPAGGLVLHRRRVSAPPPPLEVPAGAGEVLPGPAPMSRFATTPVRRWGTLGRCSGRRWSTRERYSARFWGTLERRVVVPSATGVAEGFGARERTRTSMGVTRRNLNPVRLPIPPLVRGNARSVEGQSGRQRGAGARRRCGCLLSPLPNDCTRPRDRQRDGSHAGAERIATCAWSDSGRRVPRLQSRATRAGFVTRTARILRGFRACASRGAGQKRQVPMLY
jgi:hypothetical protein